MENKEPWEARAALIVLPGPVFLGSEKNIYLLTVGEDVFEATVVDLHGQSIVMLFYFLAHVPIKSLQLLTLMALL